MNSTDTLHFAAFIMASYVLFVAVLYGILRERVVRPRPLALICVAGVVTVGGMLFAKLGANAGWPPWVYYGIPATATVFLPPVVFHMRSGEASAYICAAILMAPAIHVCFSLMLGWKEYLPFWAVPSLRELLS